MKRIRETGLALLLCGSVLFGQELMEGMEHNASLALIEPIIEVESDDEIEEVEIKHSLQPNMIHIYDMQPDTAESISEIFSKGAFYGRLRFNSFGYAWGEESEDSREDHWIVAIGGSLNYKSAPYHGLSFTAGLYTTQALGSLNDSESYLYKPGKDTISRYSALSGDPKGITTFAEAYLEYMHDLFSIKAGRQIFESFLTKSNDTKMIPNSFEGLTATIDNMLGTFFKVGYLTKQKLRDHKTFHHLLAYGDDADDPYTKYTQNDDSAMHRGLTLSALEERGIDDRLVIIEAKNRMIKNLSMGANVTAVPDLVTSVMLQASYKMYLGEFSIIPGFRYMQQFDRGAGEIGGANLKGNTEGYDDPDNLDSSLVGARVDFVEDGYKLRFGYTKVADKGDIIAPWRGFPTSGFTRPMGQYNWNANTKSYMVQFEYEYSGFTDIKVVSQYVRQDFDDDKAGVQADSDVFVLNILKGFGYGGESNVYLKTRYAHAIGEDDIVTSGGYQKTDPSYDEIRFEINYLF